MYDEFFAKAHELVERGEPFATATVVRAEKPTSGKPGDKAIVTASGVMYGWIGGSCAQPTVIEEAMEAIAADRSRLIRITPNPGSEAPPGVKEVVMTCFSGGTVDIYVEPQQPKPRLLILGHLPTAQALAYLGKAMSYHTIAVDLETGGESVAHADEVLTELEGISERVNPLTYVVVASHGHYDEAAVETALKTPAPYVGLVASRKRAASVLDYLRRQGLGDKEFERLKAPAGLDIGACRGDEIALSIMAEIVQHRRSVERLDWPSADAPPPEVTAAESRTAVDPMCGMTVAVAGAAHSFEHEGEVYYFCCGGCRTRFSEDPAAYLRQAGAP